MSVTKVSSAMTVVQPRNFIIDGDFTQWPEGTAARTAVNSAYGPALLGTDFSSTGSFTTEQSTDVPTIDESGHLSQFSVLTKCTGTDASPAVGEHNALRYYMTGTDFKPLHEQQVTISFWCKTAAANSGDTYTLALFNNSVGRSYVTDFTATSSWTKITKTITLDTSGTWTIADTTVGIVVCITLQAGSTYQGTADSWEGAFDLGTSSTSNFMDSTSNEFYISQLQLVLGSTSPNFLGESITTVARQVEYYVERYSLDSASNEHLVNINGTQTSTADSEYRWAVRKRAAPTVTFTAGATFAATTVSAGATCTAITASTIVPTGFRLRVTQAGTTWTIGGGGNVRRDGSDTANVLFDARH